MDLGIGAIDYLRRQRAVQHLPDRSELEGARGGNAPSSGGYVSTFITKAQVRQSPRGARVGVGVGVVG